jgi:hypothetical protein
MRELFNNSSHRVISSNSEAALRESALGQKQPLNNLEILTPEWLVLGVKQPLATQPQWLLLGKADSSKVVNLMNMSGCFRPEAAAPSYFSGGPPNSGGIAFHSSSKPIFST